ncbi:MAG TPA: FHA domain-containing protein [Polyangiaceae bacterium]|nr:FHA domain-containing protein [Polyangiaceae bacterium]
MFRYQVRTANAATGMWKLSILDDQGQKTIVPLVRDDYTIGRSDENTIRLTERNVSRRHAQLFRVDQTFVVVDPGSMHGVFVNGVRIGRDQELAHRDQLTIGDYRLEILDEDLETQEQGHRPFSQAPPSSNRLRDRLVVLIGPNQGAEYLLDGDRFLIGRGEECDFCVDHASVSRVHAEVRRVEGETFEIVDKASANGVRINGQEMPRALLDSRDVVELGDVVLKFIPQGQVFRADRAEGQRIAALGGLPHPTTELQPTGLGRRFAAAAVGGLLAGILALVIYSHWRGDSDAESAATSPRSDAIAASPAASPINSAAPQIEQPAAVAAAETPLADAQKALDAGDLAGARTALDRVPATDPLRQSPEYQALERAWADATIRAALAHTDTQERRNLLDSVAKTESLPTEIRERAFAALAETQTGSIDLSDLEGQPKARPVSVKKRR